MIPQSFSAYRKALVGIFAGCLCLPLIAQTPDELISKGWSEYQFLSLDLSETYFRKALAMDLTPEQQQEATIGLAMSLQFPEKGHDLDKAEDLYQRVLEQKPEGELRDLVLSNLADLHLSRGEDGEAVEILDELIQSRLDSVIGQEALRRRMLIQQGAFGSDISRKVADEAAALIRDLPASQEDPQLLPLLHEQIGTLYFWLNEFKLAAHHFEQFSLVGNADTTSYGSQSSNLYRLAKLYAEKLNNPERAAHFYTRLVKEYPNSNIMYYALEKAVEAGTITRPEVEKMNLSGMTDEILNELFDAQKRGNS